MNRQEAQTDAYRPSRSRSGEPPGQSTPSDGHTSLTATPLCDGARHWLNKGADPATYIVTIWSSGSTHWTSQSTVG